MTRNGEDSRNGGSTVDNMIRRGTAPSGPTQAQREALLESVDWSKFQTETGERDEAAANAWIDRALGHVAPTPPRPDLGQGNRGTPPPPRKPTMSELLAAAADRQRESLQESLERVMQDTDARTNGRWS